MTKLVKQNTKNNKNTQLDIQPIIFEKIKEPIHKEICLCQKGRKGWAKSNVFEGNSDTTFEIYLSKYYKHFQMSFNTMLQRFFYGPIKLCGPPKRKLRCFQIFVLFCF